MTKKDLLISRPTMGVIFPYFQLESGSETYSGNGLPANNCAEIGLMVARDLFILLIQQRKDHCRCVMSVFSKQSPAADASLNMVLCIRKPFLVLFKGLGPFKIYQIISYSQCKSNTGQLVLFLAKFTLESHFIMRSLHTI
jgi:hypothetical protein